jgi:hypothetical protein
MDITAFSIWKFRYIEGYLQDMHAFDVHTTKYVDPRTFDVTMISYDTSREVATLDRDGYRTECTFSELENTLKRLGMYRVRPEDSRHALAGPQRETN